MLISEEVEISVLNNNKKLLISKGYDISNKKIIIKIQDLPYQSKVLVSVICDICGNNKEISYCNYNKSIKSYNIYSCSSVCSNFKKKLTSLERYGTEWAIQSDDVKEKVRITNLKKYGVSCTLQHSKNKEDIILRNIEKWGFDYPTKSENVKEKTKQTNLERYGCHPSKLENVKEKTKQTNIERYDVDNPMKNSYISNKVQITKLEKYGDENFNNRDKFILTNLNKYGKFYTQTDDYKTKTKQTNLEKYKTEYASQSDLVKNRVKITKFEKYGDENFNNINKTKITNLEKYGVEYTLQSVEIREKITSTNIEKYGVENIIELDNVILKRKKAFDMFNKKYAIDTYSKLISSDYKIIDYASGDFIIEHNGHQFLTSLKLLYDRLKFPNINICTVCNQLHSNSSSYENEIFEWLLSMNIDVEQSNRKILNRQELDLYIPKNKIAIEFNGLYWHSELFKNKNYHLAKTKKCLELGIELIHVFEDDWVYKKEIVKSIIKNRLGVNKNKIYARKCYIRELSLKECKDFLIKNHIQGYSRCKYKIGLFYNNILVSVMTFGDRKINSKLDFELIRFCNVIDTNIIGGASKLFNFFIKNYNFIGKIVSYADISLFSGGLYKNLGFNFIHESKPNYFWVVDGVRHHRFKYNKKKLVEKFNSDPNKTESIIMNELGHYKIWSCGQIRYEIIIK